MSNKTSGADTRRRVIIEGAIMDAKIAEAISAYGEAAMRFAEGSTTMAATELEPARARLEKLLTETVSLSMYEMVRRERDEYARRCRIMEDALTRIRAADRSPNGPR